MQCGRWQPQSCPAAGPPARVGGPRETGAPRTPRAGGTLQTPAPHAPSPRAPQGAEPRSAGDAAGQPKATTSDADSDDDGEGGGGDGPKLTKKQRKAMQLARIAELKQATARPDVVEVWDVTAPDPHLLVYLKVCVWVCFCVFWGGVGRV